MIASKKNTYRSTLSAAVCSAMSLPINRATLIQL